MTATIGLVLDCTNPVELAHFWSEAPRLQHLGSAGNYMTPSTTGPPAVSIFKLLLEYRPETAYNSVGPRTCWGKQGMNESRVSSSIDAILASARARLNRVAPQELEREQIEGAVIVDIRPADQRARDGTLPGAIVIDRNVLEWRLDPACDHHIPEVAGYDTRIVIVCNEGYSSSLAAALLHDVGLSSATDLIGGYQAWLASFER